MRLGYQASMVPSSPIIATASMRPRRMRLGYVPNHYPNRIKDIRFNEAEAHAPRIPWISVGNQSFDFIASMRPRRMRLGYCL